MNGIEISSISQWKINQYLNYIEIIQVKWMRKQVWYKYGIMMKARADALDLEWIES